MPGERSHTGTGEYRYGFNGQEKSDEINNGSYTAEFWQYDSTLGRRWNRDPVVKVFQGSYVAFKNNPMFYVDPNGDTEYYNKSGKWIGTDGNINDKSRIVVTDKSIRKEILTNTKQGLYYEKAIETDSKIEVPEDFILQASLDVFDRTKGKTEYDPSRPGILPDTRGGAHEEGALILKNNEVVHLPHGSAKGKDGKKRSITMLGKDKLGKQVGIKDARVTIHSHPFSFKAIGDIVAKSPATPSGKINEPNGKGDINVWERHDDHLDYNIIVGKSKKGAVEKKDGKYEDKRSDVLNIFNNHGEEIWGTTISNIEKIVKDDRGNNGKKFEKARKKNNGNNK
jgi:RHS repeat-associated protein